MAPDDALDRLVAVFRGNLRGSALNCRDIAVFHLGDVAVLHAPLHILGLEIAAVHQLQLGAW